MSYHLPIILPANPSFGMTTTKILKDSCLQDTPHSYLTEACTSHGIHGRVSVKFAVWMTCKAAVSKWPVAMTTTGIYGYVIADVSMIRRWGVVRRLWLGVWYWDCNLKGIYIIQIWNRWKLMVNLNCFLFLLKNQLFTPNSWGHAQPCSADFLNGESTNVMRKSEIGEKKVNHFKDVLMGNSHFWP